MEGTGTFLEGGGDHQEHQRGKGGKGEGKTGFRCLQGLSAIARKKCRSKTNFMATSQGRNVTLLSRFSIIRFRHESVSKINMESVKWKRIESSRTQIGINVSIINVHVQ